MDIASGVALADAVTEIKALAAEICGCAAPNLSRRPAQ